MYIELEKRVSHIENLRDIHIELQKETLMADGGKLFPLDLLATAATKRSLSLCLGFAALVRARNYSTSAVLLRLQLDCCLRFFSAFIVEDPHDFAHRVLKGEHVRNQKDRNGNRMTDRYLVETLGEKYDWMPRVYEATSGFVHLSDRHIFNIARPSDEERSISMAVTYEDDYPEYLWIEMADGFLASTDALFEYIKGWQITKANPELVAKQR